MRGVVRSELVDAAENVGRMATVLDSWATDDDSGGESDGEDCAVADDSNGSHREVEDGTCDHEEEREGTQDRVLDEQRNDGCCEPDLEVHAAQAAPAQELNSRPHADEDADSWRGRLSAAWDGAFGSDAGQTAGVPCDAHAAHAADIVGVAIVIASARAAFIRLRHGDEVNGNIAAAAQVGRGRLSI